MANITGDSGDNLLTGTVNNDVIRGLDGNDTLEGKEANDSLDGGNGNDVIFGQDGNDTLRGNNGNDLLDPGLGLDTVNGGAGTDTLSADYTNLNYYDGGVYNYADGIYSRVYIYDRIVGYTGIEQFNVTGTAFDDDFTVAADDHFDAGGGSGDVLSLDLGLATTAVTVNLSAATNQVSYNSTQVNNFETIGEMMTLGIDNATLTGLGIKLDGQLAHIARRLAYLYRLPTWEHQLKVGLNWIGQPLREVMGMGNR